MSNETVPSLKGCTLRLGLDSLKQLSFKPKGSLFPLPPVICVPHRQQMQGIHGLYFFPPSWFWFGFLVFFSSARPVPWLSLLCTFTNTSTITRLGQELWMGTLNPVEKIVWNSLGWRALSPKRACSNLMRKTFCGLYFQKYLRHLEIQDWLFLNKRAESTTE